MAAAANKAVFVFDNQKIFCYCKESHGSMTPVYIRGDYYGEYSSDEFENSFKSYILYLKDTNRIADPETYSCYLIILDNNISFAAAENIFDLCGHKSHRCYCSVSESHFMPPLAILLHHR